MPYTLKGRLCGYLCKECEEPLAHLLLRLYRPQREDEVTARAAAKPTETVAILSDEEAEAKSRELIAETELDDQGRFSVQLDDKGYDGGPLEIDVYCKTVPRPKVPGDRKPLQLSITTLQPKWRRLEGNAVAVFEYCLPSRLWCWILAYFGVWTICGRLVSCDERRPIPGATVSAFDADWTQDDPLGSAITDGSGRFFIYYTVDDFTKTPFSWLGISFELFPGPDLYFSAVLGGIDLLNEDRSTGRTPGRENVGPCFCVELCSDEVRGPVEGEPHWQSVWDFDIHPAPGLPGADFDAEGYAGGATAAYVFSGGVLLRGNVPLRSLVSGKSLEYRFLYGEWTWPGTPDDPNALPSVAPAGLLPIEQIVPTEVGWVRYFDATSTESWAKVVVTTADMSPDGWIKVDGKAVTADMHDGTTQTVIVDQTNYLRTDRIFTVNSAGLTGLHPAKLTSLPMASAGHALTNAEKEPIRRYGLRFEVREAAVGATPPGPVFASDHLDKVVFNNSPVVAAVNLQELLANLCDPVTGNNVHVLYTVDHPHLRSFSVQISNNGGVVHPAPPLPTGAFTAGSYFFRGGNSPGGGSAVNIGADPACAYAVTLSWLTRIFNDGSYSTQVLYCK